MKANRITAFSVRQRGFTMVEMLAVMAVIMILSGIAVPSGMRVLNGVRQMSLNRSAETIYMTAQRNLIAYKVRGHATPPSSPGSPDASGIYTVSFHDNRTLPDAAVNIVLSANTISPALYAHQWTIQYNAQFQVTGVYYSELDDTTIVLETVYASGELGKVGYYG